MELPFVYKHHNQHELATNMGWLVIIECMTMNSLVSSLKQQVEC